MKFQELQMIYPTARFLSIQTEEDTQQLIVPVAEGYATLPKEELTAKELLLLQLLTQQESRPELTQKHRWYRVLFEKEVPEEARPVRVLQIHLRHTQDFLKNEWREALTEIFPGCLDLFFLNEQDVLLIEAKAEHNYPPKELAGVFQALDGDFDQYTQLFVGSFLLSDDQLAASFQKERELFITQLQHSDQRSEFTLASTLTKGLLAKELQDEVLLQNLYRQWFNPEILPILASLWNQQGNVSSVAKELFLHRNTVLYRIDKFQEQTQLDLKCMDDLLLCHLLMETFAK